MHYYQFNIGDYQSHTAHLDEMEDLAYRRLLDWAYLHESPIPLDIGLIARQIRMRSHTDCIESVLQEFFVRTDDGWVSQRVQQEIEAVGIKKQKARASANARWNANALRSESEGNAPITQDTLPKTQEITHDLATARSSPAAPISEIVGMYNTILPMLPQVTVVSESRKRLVAARWREVVTTDKLDREKGLEFFEWFFKHVRGSRFLTGQAKDWKANFEFLFTASKFPRIIEGAYHEDKK